MIYKCKISPLIIMAVLGLFIATNSFAQNYKIIYLAAYQRDTTESHKIREEAQLIINEGRSLFQMSNHAQFDSIRYHGIERKKSSNYTPYPIDIIKDYNTNKLTFYEDILKDKNVFYYDEPMLNKENWQLSSDTMTIGNHLCQKAEIEIGNRKWTAWFDPNIPISDGPYKFAGLPGLIVKMNDVTNSWSFILSTIEKIGGDIKINLSYLPEPKEIVRADFLKMRKEMLDNMIDIQEAAGTLNLRMKGDVNNVNMKKNYANARKKDNNWIER